MVDRTSGMPAYRQVAEAIRSHITTGEYAPGTMIPSERDLIEEYGVSRVTVRDAIQMLRNEGVLVAEHGRGVFVKQPAQIQRLARNRLSRATREQNKSAFLGDADTAGFTPTVSTEIRFEPADADTAAALEIEEGAEVCVRDRVMRADGLAVQLAVSRLPRTITRDTVIEEAAIGDGGLYARLEETGRQLDHFVEAVRCRMPNGDEKRALQLSDGVPVMVVTRVAHTAERPVEINTMIMAGDRYELAYEFPAE